jgi:hypothetical protein
VRVPSLELNGFVEAYVLGYLAVPHRVQKLISNPTSDAELQKARDDVAAVTEELEELAEKLGSGAITATLAAKAEPGILARLGAAQKRETDLSTPSMLAGLITPGDGVHKRWGSMPIAAKRELLRILLQPGLLGQLRLGRTVNPGTRCAIEDRVTFHRE